MAAVPSPLLDPDHNRPGFYRGCSPVHYLVPIFVQPGGNSGVCGIHFGRVLAVIILNASNNYSVTVAFVDTNLLEPLRLAGELNREFRCQCSFPGTRHPGRLQLV